MTAPYSDASAALGQASVSPLRQKDQQAPAQGPFPPCADCGKPPKVIRYDDGVLVLWHWCRGDGVSLGATDEEHARELWAGYAQERAR